MFGALLYVIVAGILSEPSAASASFIQAAGNGSHDLQSTMRRAATTATALSSTNKCSGGNCRRLIVDTDLGLDDLVALAILRVQQCIYQSQRHALSGGRDSQQQQPQQHSTPFRLSGVTITTGISCANSENAALLRRLLPPNTPVYVGGNTDASLTWMNEDKPAWWTRTAHRVKSFMSSISLSPTHQSAGQLQDDGAECRHDITAEEFIASSMDDPSVDVLCMAPLSTVARALQLRSERQEHNKADPPPPKATFYVMGGIRSDSKMTKRGESTAPFGYHDPIGDSPPDAATTTTAKRDTFGEFNFALDIGAARTVLSSIATRIIPLEACTLVPRSLRSATVAESVATLSSTLKDIQPSTPVDTTNFDADPAHYELHSARGILRKLLQEFGTTETQWDSISAAIYCNEMVGSATRGVLTEIDSEELSISDLGALSFPGCDMDEMPNSSVRASSSHLNHIRHFIYPTFTEEVESKFFEYVSFLLGTNIK
mmetsp:Transcript_21316/g.51536  ORF Transcript_21316/g.51536 Transcript_21316/m.51536 type:complete len:487 (-) Transcript_21316:37-1497(-)